MRPFVRRKFYAFCDPKVITTGLLAPDSLDVGRGRSVRVERVGEELLHATDGVRALVDAHIHARRLKMHAVVAAGRVARHPDDEPAIPEHAQPASDVRARSGAASARGVGGTWAARARVSAMRARANVTSLSHARARLIVEQDK